MVSWFRKPPAQGSLPEAEDDDDRALLGNIARVGWSVLQIDPDSPKSEVPYSFTVGLFYTYRHAEIILLGLPHPIAGEILNNIGATVKLGNKIETERVYEDFINAGNVFKTVDPRHYEEYVGYALWLYQWSAFPVIQCVWPLKTGEYPWDPGYPPEGAGFQPYLGES